MKNMSPIHKGMRFFSNVWRHACSYVSRQVGSNVLVMNFCKKTNQLIHSFIHSFWGGVGMPDRTHAGYDTRLKSPIG